MSMLKFASRRAKDISGAAATAPSTCTGRSVDELPLTTLSPTKIARLQVQLRAQTIQRRGAPLRSAPLGSVRLRSAPLGSARAPLTSGVSLGLVCRAAAHAGEPPSVHDGEPPSVHEYTAGSRPGYRWSVRPQQRRVLSIGRGRRQIKIIIFNCTSPTRICDF